MKTFAVSCLYIQSSKKVCSYQLLQVFIVFMYKICQKNLIAKQSAKKTQKGFTTNNKQYIVYKKLNLRKEVGIAIKGKETSSQLEPGFSSDVA